MRSLSAAIALSLLMTSTSALALRPIDPIFDPTDPIFEPPVDPCILNPLLCEPPPPPPPCETVLCPGEDPPPAVDPGPSFSHFLNGTATVKGEGFKTSEPYTVQMNFDTSTLTFLMMDGAGHLYSGHLVPKGTTGTKFKLFLDGPSTDALSADVAARGATASGRSAGSVLGESGKLTLKTFEDGSTSLKIKTSVLVTGLGEVSFKANLTGVSQ